MRATIPIVLLATLLVSSGVHAQDEVEVVICGPHHAVLAHWLRAAQEGRVPARGLTVVHFDAHPDLGVPELPLAAALRSDPQALVRRLDISSFQLAAVWVGLVGRVVWLRPAWADQLPDGTRRFAMGVAADGRLRVDDESDYYVLDGAWAARDALRDAVEVEIEVLPLADAAPRLATLEGPFVLDIDLDGFATHSPAAETLRRAGFSDAALTTVRRAFAREKLRLAAEPGERIADLEAIRTATEDAAGGGIAAQLGSAWRLWRFGVEARDLLALRRVLLEAPAPGLLVEHGRDLVGLPEHAADPEEIERTADLLAALLRDRRPPLVTIARSVDDGYTPRAAWPRIEWTLLRELGESLGNVPVRLDAGLRPAPAFRE